MYGIRRIMAWKISKIHAKRVSLRIGSLKKHPVPILKAQKRHPVPKLEAQHNSHRLTQASFRLVRFRRWFKTHYYIIFFIRPLHPKPGMESYCLPSTYRPIVIVGLWYKNQSGVTELLIMRDLHYVRMCQLKPSEFYILSCEKSLGLRPRRFSQLRM